MSIQKELDRVRDEQRLNVPAKRQVGRPREHRHDPALRPNRGQQARPRDGRPGAAHEPFTR